VLVDLNPFAVASHMLLSQAIVACAVVLLRRAGEPDGPRHPVVSSRARRLCWALSVVTGAAIVAGTVVTGAGPHAGSADVRRFDVEISDAARIHGTLVLFAVGLAIVLALGLQRRPADRRALQGVLSSWIFIAVLQATIGYVQYFNDVPALLVGLHIAGATALWSMTVWLLLSTSAPAPAAAPADGARSERGAVRPAGTFTP
jgi:cytochrome c oxidase assembly protein subunit 15